MQADVLGMGWRAIFLINLPVGVAILCSLALIPKTPLDGRLKGDKPGTILFALAVAAVVVPMIEGRSLGWPWWTLALPLVGLLIGVAFVAFGAWARSRRVVPNAACSTSSKSTVHVRSVARRAVVYRATGPDPRPRYYLQSGLQLSPFEAGLLISPFPAGVMVASIVTARLPTSTQSLRIVLGAGTILFGLVVLNVAFRIAGASSHCWQIAPAAMVCGFGMGVAVVALYPKVLSVVARTDAGAGSGTLQALQHVGVVLGIAAMSEVFFASLEAGEVAVGRSNWSNAAANTTVLGMVILIVLLAALGWQSRQGSARETTVP